MVKYNIV